MKKMLMLFQLVFCISFSFAQTGYTITGAVDGKNTSSYIVSLSRLDGRHLIELDAVKVLNNKFSFTGSVQQPELCLLTLKANDENNTTYKRLLVLENAAISIHFNEQGEAAISGTPTNDSFQEYQAKMIAAQRRVKELYGAYAKAMQDGKAGEREKQQLDIEEEKLTEERTSILVDFVKSNIGNIAGQYILSLAAKQLGFEVLDEIISGADPEVLQSDMLKGTMEFYNTVQNVAVGKPYVDITMADPNKEKMSISNYAAKGKYLLIHFWTSWCEPCRREMPSIVALYEKYKDKGFEIIGISLDSQRDEWVKAIKHWNMTWPQMSDLKYQDSEAYAAYGIYAVPSKVLLDKEGTIVASSIHEKEFDKLLVKFLGQ